MLTVGTMILINLSRYPPRASVKIAGRFHGRQIVPRRYVSNATSPGRSPEVAREIYLSPTSRSLQSLAYVGAVTQIFFWGNLAQWAATGYAVKDTYNSGLCLVWYSSRETGEFKVASTSTRYIYAGWLAGMGAAFAYAFLFFPSRWFLVESLD